jgi:hypothetical protein
LALQRLSNLEQRDNQGRETASAKTNGSLQFVLEAAHEVGVAIMGSNRGLHVHGVKTADQAVIFEGAPKALRGSKLRHRILKFGQLVSFALGVLRCRNPKGLKIRFEFKNTKALYVVPIV